ncbi:MAG TPA: AI-2E family transporter [Nocardioidaceae bacterium]|nr:AI-2E family transporter [Nocardioidaceae bacterium]
MGIGKRLSGSMSRVRDRQRRKSEDRFAERFATQWAQVRAERRPDPEPRIEGGPSNFTRAQVPWAVDLAAAWSWRFLVIVAAGAVVAWVVARFSVIVLPLVIALLITALAVPLVNLGERAGVNRKLGSALVVVGGLGVVALLLTFVGTQVAQGFSDLADQVVGGLEEIRHWLRTGPLKASDSQINDYIKAAQDAVTNSNEQVVSRVTEVGTTIGHIVAGFFIVLFASFFFLADGARIWAWVVRLFPRAARVRTDASGRVAWKSLTQFVRATVLVALVDAIGIMLVALILKVPFATAIGVLVFLGAFIPMIGATLSGSVAVLVALVSHGPLVALLMLAGVIVVQQIEAHVLQPFLLGRFVAVHPLGVIVAIGCGVLVAGVAGALVAVPLAAALNAVAQYLAGDTTVGDATRTTQVSGSASVGSDPPED